MTLKAPTHTGTIHVYSNTWFCVRRCRPFECFRSLVFVVRVAVVPQHSRIKDSLLQIQAPSRCSGHALEKFVVPLKPTIRSLEAAKDSFQRLVGVAPLHRIVFVSSAHGDNRGKKGVLCFWAASGGGCDHDEKSMINGERWVGVGIGPVVHDAFAHLLSIPNMRKTYQ